MCIMIVIVCLFGILPSLRIASACLNCIAVSIIIVIWCLIGIGFFVRIIISIVLSIRIAIRCYIFISFLSRYVCYYSMLLGFHAVLSNIQMTAKVMSCFLYCIYHNSFVAKNIYIVHVYKFQD